MAVKLGWKVALDVAVFANGHPQDVTLAVRRGSREEHLLAPWRMGIADLANAVNHGAMCGATMDPTRSRMEVRGVEMRPNGDIVTSFAIGGIDAGAWRTITALAVFFTYGAPDPAVRIVGERSGAGRPQVTHRNVWSLAYPGVPSNLPFALDREEDPTSNDVLVRIRFKRKLSGETKDVVLGAVKSWATLLFGGYPNDGEDMTTCATSSNAGYLVDPRTVEYSAEYTGHTGGLDAVVSMALWFHNSGAAVESVLIE